MKAAVVVVSLLVLLGLLAAVIVPGFLPSSRGVPTIWPHQVLNWIANAQRDYSANDRSRSGKKDFWKADIAGLYTLKYPDGLECRLINLPVACADDRPIINSATPGPKAPLDGYWFRAIKHANETVPNPSRFAVCGFPDHYIPGNFTFVIDEHYVVYKKDLGRGGGLEQFPMDPIAEGWQ